MVNIYYKGEMNFTQLAPSIFFMITSSSCLCQESHWKAKALFNKTVKLSGLRYPAG